MFRIERPAVSKEASYHYLKEAKQYYPNFDIWYFTNVLPSVTKGDKEIIIIERDNRIAGIAIIKYSEKKICTLKVIDAYKNRGIGLRLFELCYEKLGTRHPHFTISEEKMPEFQRLIDHYGHKLTSIRNGYYRKDVKEYFFNEGVLDEIVV